MLELIAGWLRGWAEYRLEVVETNMEAAG